MKYTREQIEHVIDLIERAELPDEAEIVRQLLAENDALREDAEQMKDALESIALAGMSGSGQESEEGMKDWHVRRAWEFIGIAARAIDAARKKG